MARAFSDVLKEGTPLLFDGATGTELYKRGIFINRCFESANIHNEDLVLSVYRDYVSSGAQILTTNTWGANRLKLREHNLDDKIFEIHQKACSLAKKASAGQTWIAGSIGPLGVRVEPFGPTSFAEAQDIFRESIAFLLEGGVDLLTLETFSDLSELQQALLAARALAPDLSVMAHVTITAEGLTPYGTPLEWVIKKLDEWGADVIGLNCSVGPQPMLTSIEKIKKFTSRPLSVRPNAGLPRQTGGRQIYMSTPEYFAHFAKEFLQAGVQFIGGCCGTAPEHIRAMSNALRYSKAIAASHKRAEQAEGAGRVTSDQKSSPLEKISESSPALDGLPPVPFEEKSHWSRKLAKGEFVCSVELLPPGGMDPSKILEHSQFLKDAGVDAINIPDGPRASARMSAILTAIMIEQKVGIETVLHYTCRDRNLLGMQSDLLGAHAMGLRNLLLVTGDPPKLGNYPNATGVFDVDAIGLTNMVHRLNTGLDLGGRSIGKTASFSIGVGVNPAHKDFEYEMGRFSWKVDAGAEWAITQPVFDTESLKRFLDHIDGLHFSIPIVIGIWPLTSYRNALFMKNEVPGVVVPDFVVARMAEARDADEARKLGIDLAIEMLEKSKSLVQGVQVSAPFGRVDMALSVLGLSS
ncbi:MAG: bifunctional homocysteine S-methyltransferase/methylenetetrahydrofolate reductase [Oligoflexales bacterium]|nr:bifunctional homocysteine S-methyltransferase/methylenetetrahydrofolate reductase [Oligoflexales bacterium]